MKTRNGRLGVLLTRILAIIGPLALLAGSAVAGEVESRIFQDGARWRGEDYARARDMLVRGGDEIIPLLERKKKSKDWCERMFAHIIISRIKQPGNVVKWNKALKELVSYDVAQTIKGYREPDWDKLPKTAADVPTSHLVDVLWEYGGRNGRHNSMAMVAALQFYLAPSIDALEPAVEILAGPRFKFLAREGILKLGAQAIPRMRQVLDETGRPPLPRTPGTLTPEEEEALRAFRVQAERATVAAYVLSRLGDMDSVSRITKCLRYDNLDRGYIESFSESLAHMKAISAIDAILDHLLRFAQRTHGDINNAQGYDLLRSYVVSFGKDAIPTLKRRLRTATAESDRIVLENMAFELSGVQGKQKKVAAVLESLWFDETADGLLKLHELTGEDVFPRLRDMAFENTGHSGNLAKRKQAMLAFAKLKETRAVPMLAGMLKWQHENLERTLAKYNTKQNAKPFDAQVVREAAHTFDRRETDTARILFWGDTALLSLRGIGGTKARKAIQAAAAYPEYKARAEMCLLAVDGKVGKLAENLGDKDRAVREGAALALLETGDPRTTPELLRAAARRQGPRHQQWKQYALSSREDIVLELRKLLKSDDLRERVLAEAMLLEAESSDKATRCSQSLLAAAQAVASMHSIHIGSIEGAGRGIVIKAEEVLPDNVPDAEKPSKTRILSLPPYGLSKIEKLDESCIPLVEAECLFGQGVIRRGVAAFALAEWKRPRSMPVLVESFNMGSLGGSNPAALALADFGEEGAELAAKVPPPKPGEYDTGLRMTAHRTSTRVLAEQKDIRGVDEILKGLKTLDEDKSIDRWAYRARIYLAAAGKFHDKRLVEPLLRILNTQKAPNRGLHGIVIPLLAAYDDPRLVPLFTERLAAPENHNDKDTADFSWGKFYEVAITALTRRLGENTPKYLIEQYNRSNDDKLRGAILLALGELSYPTSPRWSADRFKNQPHRKEVAGKTQKMAYPVLLAAIDDPSKHVNYMAAVGLMILAQKKGSINPELRTVEPLTKWCQKQGRCFYPLVKFLAVHGDRETGRVLLDIFKSQPATNADRRLARAIGSLKPKGAVPVLARNVRAYKGWHHGAPAELEALAEFGEEGLAAMFDIFNDTDKMACRLASADLLARKGYKNAADPIEEFLRKTIEAGSANPKLELVRMRSESREQAYVHTCAALLKALDSLSPDRAKQIARDVIVHGPDPLRAACLKLWVDK